MNDATPITIAPAAQSGKTFIPLSRTDVIEAALSQEPFASDAGRQLARSVFHKIGCLRQHQSAQALNELAEVYDPFNPDDDTINQESLGVEQRVDKRRLLVEKLRQHAVSANYEELTEQGLEDVLANATPDGVDVDVDFTELEVKLIFFRGEGDITRSKRDIKRLYLKTFSYTVPTYQRLCMAIKFKTEDVRIAEIMQADKVGEASAKKKLHKLRKRLPVGASTDHVYLKIFKNIPIHDVEMLFPNIRVKMKYRDKVQLGGSALLGTITWAIGTATKLLVAVALSPVMLALALVTGVGGILYAQIRNIFITRDRYRMQLAQSLYFQNLANNQGALALMVDEAEEEDVKEEVLLYSHMLERPVPLAELDALDRRIEAFLRAKFRVEVNFDMHEAMERLLACGLLARTPAGELQAMPLAEADKHLHQRWCDALEAH